MRRRMITLIVYSLRTMGWTIHMKIIILAEECSRKLLAVRFHQSHVASWRAEDAATLYYVSYVSAKVKSFYRLIPLGRSKTRYLTSNCC